MVEVVVVYGLVGAILGSYASFATTFVYKYFFHKKAAIIRAGSIISVVWLSCILILVILDIYESFIENTFTTSGYTSLFISMVFSFCVGYFILFDGRKLEKKVKEGLMDKYRNR